MVRIQLINSETEWSMFNYNSYLKFQQSMDRYCKDLAVTLKANNHFQGSAQRYRKYYERTNDSFVDFTIQ